VFVEDGTALWQKDQVEGPLWPQVQSLKVLVHIIAYFEVQGF